MYIFILPALALIIADIFLIRHGGKACAIAAACLNAVPLGLFLFLWIAVGKWEWYVWTAWTITGLLLDGFIVGWVLRYWNTRRLIVWSVCFVLAASGVAGSRLYHRHKEETACQRMMAAVGIKDYPGIDLSYIGSWTDPLKYKDGYEIMYISTDRDSELTVHDIVPVAWTWEDISIEDLENRLRIQVDTQPISEYSMGGYDCNAWFFADNRGNGIPWNDQDYCLGYYDEFYDIIWIYRGHHLYGLNH